MIKKILIKFQILRLLKSQDELDNPIKNHPFN